METAVQQHVVQFPSEISASNFVLNKISTCSDTAIHIVDSPHRKRAPSLQKISVSSNIKRRFSGALSINDSGSVKKVSLENDFVIHEQIGTGRFGKIYSAEHRQSGSKITLKFFPLPQTKLPDFIREYNFSRFVAPHPNAIDTFEGVFKTDDESSFFFVQEFCPYGSLKDLVEKTIAPGSIPGIGEKLTKMILSKVLCAVEFMHGEGLVHRNLTAANVLIFDADQFTKIKIADFGLTRYSDSNVKHLECINSYHSAELCEAVLNETITLCRAIDIWSLGIMVAYCLKAKFPWQKASIMCKPYWEWDEYLRHKTPQLPKYFEAFDEKAVKLFKHCLNPKPKDRWSIKDLKKFIEKEQLEKSKIPVDELMYYPEDDSKCSAELKQQRKSAISQWINTVSNTVSEISDQVVSARDDGLC